jgi:coenzyme F420-reducing hydrogenase beta subunit
MTTSSPADLSGVLSNDMCIACGACVFADPSLKLQLHPEKLIFEPSHAGNQAAADVCPAVSVDFETLQGVLFPGAKPTEYGVVHSVMLAQSTDLERNVKASSGGMVKEILADLLSRDDVDGAIVLKHVDGLNFEPTLITEPAEVDTLPGSIYHNLPKDRVLELLRENEGRFVIAAIPCELEGIYNYIFKREPWLRERIHTTIGLLCGWQYSWHSIRAICEFKGIDPDTIVDISYRGGGPIGKLRILTADGKEMTTSRRLDFGYQVAFDRTFNTPRCHLCINHSNFLADIVVGDAWLPSTLGTKTGISLVINRREESDKLVRSLAERAKVIFTEVTVNEIRESQKPSIAFGNFAYAYAEHLDELGLHRPRMDGPNKPLAKLADRHEVATFHRELRRKLDLQRARRYRFLFYRKFTKELRRYASRYQDWFVHRVLGVGRDPRAAKQAATRQTTSIFR